MALTIQAHHHGRWHDAAQLMVDEPSRGRAGPARLEYDPLYACDWLGHDDLPACSLRLPVELILLHRSPHWFGFLDDIMPSGAGRRFWIAYLGLTNQEPRQQDYELLSRGTVAPVGNLRIAQAVPEQASTQRFGLNEVVERDTDFLEYAQMHGAAGGGATGAGGEAPKLLLRRDDHERIWIDARQDDDTCLDRHYLVKFPRGARGTIDADILRTEYHYYQELNSLGIETIATEGMELREGARYPSLWLPRFDVGEREGRLERYGLESIYSLLGRGPGEYLNQFTVIRTLAQLLAQREHDQGFDQAGFTIEWVKRDLLNIAFGNADNHGRNSALIKRPEGVTLAPVYDFAPMRADPEGIVRTTTWGQPFESGGRFDWHAIAAELVDLVEPERLLDELGRLARQLVGLRDRLETRGVPSSILDMPNVGLGNLDQRINTWRLP